MKKCNLLPAQNGWFPQKITKHLDAVILGMHARIDNPELTKAKDLGVSTQSIGRTLETLYGGKRITTFNRLGKEYPIIVQQYLSDRRNKDGISKISKSL